MNVVILMVACLACDRVIWLEKGRIVGEGAPSLIVAEYEKSAQLRHVEIRPSAA